MSWLKFAAPRGVRFQHVPWAQRHRQTDACNETLLCPADAGEFLRAAVRGASGDAARNAPRPDPPKRTSAPLARALSPAVADPPAAESRGRHIPVGGRYIKLSGAI